MTNTDPTPSTSPGLSGLRPTRQRLAVAAALESFSDFRSAQEIHDLMASQDVQVGLATVYRTLQALAEGGEIDALRSEEGETVYRRCSTHHHHHLVCRACGATVEVEAPEVETFTARIAAEHGFQDVSHHLEIFGLCADCS